MFFYKTLFYKIRIRNKNKNEEDIRNKSKYGEYDNFVLLSSQVYHYT